MSIIETLTALTITAALTTLSLNANNEVLNSTKNFEYTNLEQDTVDTYNLVLSDLVADTNPEGNYETENNIITVSETICEDGNNGYLVVATNKNEETKTVATLSTCNKVNLYVKPEIKSI